LALGPIACKETVMSINEAATKEILSGIVVTREDIARAKDWLLKRAGGPTNNLADQWLSEQKLTVPKEVTTDSPNSGEALAQVARAFSVRLAFYQAVWELVSAGELIPASSPVSWIASVGFRTSNYGSGMSPDSLSCSYPATIECMPLSTRPSSDADIFLRGIDCEQLHSGILEAIDQSLGCFGRGLYMPATVMLAAAAEATWIECGVAVAKKLANKKLDGVMNDQFASISKKVTEVRRTLEQAGGKALLKVAGQHIANINNAELWTTTLRDRRNALHWGKAKSFIADHSETGTLLMAAPLHLGTLEAVRLAC
jgi:hypothetical protein